VRHFSNKKQYDNELKILAFSSFFIWIPPGYHIFEAESQQGNLFLFVSKRSRAFQRSAFRKPSCSTSMAFNKKAGLCVRE